MRNSARLFRIFSSLLLIFLSFAVPASAAPHWVQATPFGGQMVAVAEAPSAAPVLYASTVTGRVFQSLDGTTWRERHSELPGALIVDLLVDFQDARTVFARTSTTGKPALLRTHNGGLSWTAVWPGFGSVYGLALDGRTPEVLYAAAQGGLYRSTDAGDTWTVIAFANAVVFAVAIDPSDPNTLLAAVYKADEGATVFWRSADQGATWTVAPVSGAPPTFGPVVQRIVFDPRSRGTAYAVLGPQGDKGTVFRTLDDGMTWWFLPATAGVRDLLPYGTLYAAADFGVARSNSAGESWTPPLPAALTPETAPRDLLLRLIASALPKTLYAAGLEGIWRSTDDGDSWAAVNQGINALPVVSLAVAPAGPDYVLALAGDAVFRSTDRGVSWQNVHTSLDGVQPYVIQAIDLRNPQTVYGVGSDGQAAYLTKSPNAGSTWRRLSTGYSCGGDSICDVEMPAFALDPQKPSNLFLGTMTFFHFQGVSYHVQRSSDGGKTWKEMAPLNNIQSLAVDPKQGNTVYGLTCKGLFKSGNAAVSWRRGGSGLPGASSLCLPNASGGQRLAVDPSQPQTLYVGTVDKGVYASTDGGATFHPFNRGLETANAATILVSPTGSVYAAVPKRGVWRWDASLHRWTPLNASLPASDFAGVLALDPRHPSVLYAGTQNHGAYRLDP